MDGTLFKAITPQGEDPRREEEGAARPAGGRPGGPGTERRVFAMDFTSSPRGARLARRLTVKRLAEWGFPPYSDTSCTVSLLVAELAANAVRHTGMPGSGFGLRLTFEPAARTIRVEVSDACPDRSPAGPSVPSPDDESGRGLLLVQGLADHWGTSVHAPDGKTVWADVAAHWPGTP